MKENLTLIAGIVGSLLMAGIALYRARPQQQLDAATREKVEMDVKVALEHHDLEKTRRILRLETYVNKDVRYHRRQAEYTARRDTYVAALLVLLQQCITDGYLHGVSLPDPPGEPPEPPDLPEVNGD